MNIIIGDIGNTITKICFIDEKSFKIKSEFRFDSNKMYSKKFLKKIRFYTRRHIFKREIFTDDRFMYMQ